MQTSPHIKSEPMPFDALAPSHLVADQPDVLVARKCVLTVCKPGPLRLVHSKQCHCNPFSVRELQQMAKNAESEGTVCGCLRNKIALCHPEMERDCEQHLCIHVADSESDFLSCRETERFPADRAAITNRSFTDAHNQLTLLDADCCDDSDNEVQIVEPPNKPEPVVVGIDWERSLEGGFQQQRDRHWLLINC